MDKADEEIFTSFEEQDLPGLKNSFFSFSDEKWEQKCKKTETMNKSAIPQRRYSREYRSTSSQIPRRHSLKRSSPPQHISSLSGSLEITQSIDLLSSASLSTSTHFAFLASPPDPGT
ncbi:hypothetical protein Tco_0901601 [Tanacetum coccineum]